MQAPRRLVRALWTYVNNGTHYLQSVEMRDEVRGSDRLLLQLRRADTTLYELQHLITLSRDKLAIIINFQDVRVYIIEATM